MRRRKPSSGFTLIELIIAASLSSIVLIGVFSVMSTMVQTEVSGMRNGTVTAWTLASINSMNTDVAGASYLSYPTFGTPQDGLVVCTNWSPVAGAGSTPGKMDTTQSVTVYEYCYLPASNFLLRNRVLGAAVCPPAPPACALGGGWSDGVVATGVYRDPANDKIFTADSPAMNAHAGVVQLHFVVGNPKPGTSAGGSQASATVPETIAFDTRIILED